MFRLSKRDFIPNVTIDTENNSLIVEAHFYLYGTQATEHYCNYFVENIQNNWGREIWKVEWQDQEYELFFKTAATLDTSINAVEVHNNVDLRNKYVRIEEVATLNISFVDGRGSNTGYFILHNLDQPGSNTVAHEYGHMLGLWPGSPTAHPLDLDQRGKGRPGIMYPRGTIVDPQYQYDPEAKPGQKGGTMDPQYRMVKQSDVDELMKVMTPWDENHTQLGKLTNKYHDNQILLV